MGILCLFTSYFLVLIWPASRLLLKHGCYVTRIQCSDESYLLLLCCWFIQFFSFTVFSHVKPRAKSPFKFKVHPPALLQLSHFTSLNSSLKPSSDAPCPPLHGQPIWWKWGKGIKMASLRRLFEPHLEKWAGVSLARLREKAFQMRQNYRKCWAVVQNEACVKHADFRTLPPEILTHKSSE